jgi:hypothetical protein
MLLYNPSAVVATKIFGSLGSTANVEMAENVVGGDALIVHVAP